MGNTILDICTFVLLPLAIMVSIWVLHLWSLERRHKETAEGRLFQYQLKCDQLEKANQTLSKLVGLEENNAEENKPEDN